ncbi:TPA: hypothetical protein MIZ08_23810, partial [Klebsiella pneumoniae]|nr:hypothetical protein [Klebsiella pneumoniae]
GTVCVVGKMRDLILQLSKSSIYSTKPRDVYRHAVHYCRHYFYGIPWNDIIHRCNQLQNKTSHKVSYLSLFLNIRIAISILNKTDSASTVININHTGSGRYNS